MENRSLGRSGLKITNLCLGTMTFGNQADKKTSFEIMDKAFDAGISFIDTADMYPLGSEWSQLGATEEIVGDWLQGKRDRVVLATKCFGAMGPGANDKGLSRKHIMSAVEESLRRLKTDYIDLYQAHMFDPSTPLEGSTIWSLKAKYATSVFPIGGHGKLQKQTESLNKNIS